MSSSDSRPAPTRSLRARRSLRHLIAFALVAGAGLVGCGEGGNSMPDPDLGMVDDLGGTLDEGNPDPNPECIDYDVDGRGLGCDVGPSTITDLTAELGPPHLLEQRNRFLDSADRRLRRAGGNTGKMPLGQDILDAAQAPVRSQQNHEGMRTFRSARIGKLNRTIRVLPAHRRRPHLGDDLRFGRGTDRQVTSGVASASETRNHEHPGPEASDGHHGYLV